MRRRRVPDAERVLGPLECVVPDESEHGEDGDDRRGDGRPRRAPASRGGRVLAAPAQATSPRLPDDERRERHGRQLPVPVDARMDGVADERPERDGHERRAPRRDDTRRAGRSITASRSASPIGPSSASVSR